LHFEFTAGEIFHQPVRGSAGVADILPASEDIELARDPRPRPGSANGWTITISSESTANWEAD